jgi:hypothetical protein
MAPAGFQPTIPASEWPQTHCLDRVATGIGKFLSTPSNVKLVIHRMILIESLMTTQKKLEDSVLVLKVSFSFDALTATHKPR